jgi:hypothetical protein
MRGVEESDLEYCDGMFRRLSETLYWLEQEVRRVIATVEPHLVWDENDKLTQQEP